jgi:hypothetical protein
VSINDIDAATLPNETVLDSNQWIYRTKHILWVSHWRIYQFDFEGHLIRIIE